jgi:hypothetical protein
LSAARRDTPLARQIEERSRSSRATPRFSRSRTGVEPFGGAAQATGWGPGRANRTCAGRSPSCSSTSVEASDPVLPPIRTTTPPPELGKGVRALGRRDEAKEQYETAFIYWRNADPALGPATGRSDSGPACCAGDLRGSARRGSSSPCSRRLPGLGPTAHDLLLRGTIVDGIGAGFRRPRDPGRPDRRDRQTSGPPATRSTPPACRGARSSSVATRVRSRDNARSRRSTKASRPRSRAGLERGPAEHEGERVPNPAAGRRDRWEISTDTSPGSASGTAINLGTWVGLSTLGIWRRLGGLVGTAAEMAAMKALAGTMARAPSACQRLIYAPAAIPDRGIVELAACRFHGFYATHMRKRGARLWRRSTRRSRWRAVGRAGLTRHRRLRPIELGEDGGGGRADRGGEAAVSM